MNPLLNHTLKIGITLSFVFFYTACIKQSSETCPPIYRAILTIQDKNYFNIAEIPDLLPREEQAPFKSFIPSFSYQLFQINTGETADSVSNFIIQDNDIDHTIDWSSKQPGSYLLDLYANTNQLSEKKNNVTTYHLHPSGREGDDIYIFHDTITITPESSEVKIPLTRVKGALYVQIENLPDSVVKIEELVQHVYEDIDANFQYSNDISVVKNFTTNLHPTTSLLTILAPSVVEKESILRLALYTQETATPYMFIPDVPLTIKRNEITAFKFSFNPSGGVEIWVWANGVWQKLHDLDITINE